MTFSLCTPTTYTAGGVIAAIQYCQHWTEGPRQTDTGTSFCYLLACFHMNHDAQTLKSGYHLALYSSPIDTYAKANSVVAIQSTTS